MRVIGYTRVSTPGQARDGFGLEFQADAVQAWAKRSRHQLIAIASDPGKSGTLEAADRPGLLQAIRAIEDKEADALAVTNITRLARELHVQEAVLAKIWEAGGRVFEAEGGTEILRDDPEDPFRTFVRQIMGAAGQLERALIIKRMRNGRSKAAERGGRTHGRTPYGWRAVEVRESGPDSPPIKKLVPDEAEQEVIARIRKLYSGGQSLNAIAQALNKEGVPRRPGAGDTAPRWHAQTVKRIVFPPKSAPKKKP